MIAVQFVAATGLALLLPLLAVAGRKALPRWGRLLWRMRWLLVSAWLIMAYGVPGDAWLDTDWLPTEQGMIEATQQSGRLVFSLGCLAWLFERLDRDALMVALLAVLSPGGKPRHGVERLAVRLWLVMEHLQDERFKGAWRRILAGEPGDPEGPAHLSLMLPRWRSADSVFFAGVTALCVAVAALG